MSDEAFIKQGIMWVLVVGLSVDYPLMSIEGCLLSLLVNKTSPIALNANNGWWDIINVDVRETWWHSIPQPWEGSIISIDLEINPRVPMDKSLLR